MQSCWNGIAVLDPAPFYAPKPVKFRMARLPDGECSASECGLICNDYWNQGWGRIISMSLPVLCAPSCAHLYARILFGNGSKHVILRCTGGWHRNSPSSLNKSLMV